MDKINHEDIALRGEKLSLLIGTMIGQLSELLNAMCGPTGIGGQQLYNSLKDIHQMAALQLHVIYYRDTNLQ